MASTAEAPPAVRGPESFEVRLDAFSGPLDLLCHLAESRQLDAAKLPLSALLEQYLQFLLRTERVSLMEMAEFFSLASRLLLSKLRALFPSLGEETEEGGEDEPFEGISLEESLVRYRPLRNAAAWLADRQRERERCFVRHGEEGPPWFDLGDLYALAQVWWRLVEERSRDSAGGEEWSEELVDGAPEEQWVEERMEELQRLLALGPTSLRALLPGGTRGALVVTLLALLELSRLGLVTLRQEEPFADLALCLR